MRPPVIALDSGTWPRASERCFKSGGDEVNSVSREIDADLTAAPFWLVGDFASSIKLTQNVHVLVANSCGSHPWTMRIPFPHSLSVGTDIIHLSRLAKSQHHFRKLVSRILQPVEQKVLDDRFPHWSEETASKDSLQDRKRREWIGGRWAAKEAAKKAWGASLLSFKDLRVETAPGGDLLVVCAPLDGGQPSHSCDEQVARVSISHDAEYAIATVLASPLHHTIIAELGRRKSEAERNVTPQDQLVNEAASPQQLNNRTPGNGI